MMFLFSRALPKKALATLKRWPWGPACFKMSNSYVRTTSIKIPQRFTMRHLKRVPGQTSHTEFLLRRSVPPAPPASALCHLVFSHRPPTTRDPREPFLWKTLVNTTAYWRRAEVPHGASPYTHTPRKRRGFRNRRPFPVRKRGASGSPAPGAGRPGVVRREERGAGGGS